MAGIPRYYLLTSMFILSFTDFPPEYRLFRSAQPTQQIIVNIRLNV